MLHEFTVPSYVPNDTFIRGGGGGGAQEAASGQQDYASEFQRRSVESGGPSMIILTGPNFSGKSVYLKQVGSKLRLS